MKLNGWINTSEQLPETAPNTDGEVFAVLTEDGNVYRARYMHDVYDGGESKYWSEFTIDSCGRENEHYEICERVTHYISLPKEQSQ
ncbi:DUF551 domain-containing protein [Acinetobacter corruptisaponis]|uniref:DUF551 domain-containing protein n=1 Tax=Acinetobacter corruptisaponis TaxID=3045147 RepID=A0ABY8SB07_9GAMM|nr:DUF551 domain-containing protein [Acinetobacter sp. KCTC 92772]WHP06864.1 DUF551 domain-containing protein [Acinetobacter sp. KCTC 92772]